MPSTAELNQFVRTCQSGNLDLFAVYDALIEKLSSKQWQARLVRTSQLHHEGFLLIIRYFQKSLHAVEVLLKSEVDNAASYFAGRIRALEEQLSSLQKSVVDKTQQVSLILLDDTLMRIV